MDIIEGNKVIAEFMGMKFIPKDEYVLFDRVGNVDGDWKSIEELKYHSSWDWLMPVWVKAMIWYTHEFGLLTATFELSSLGIIINAKHSSAFKYAYSFGKNITEEEIKKEVWASLTYFIQWYKEQKAQVSDTKKSRL